MVLSCIDSEQFQLEYDSFATANYIGVKELRSYKYFFPRHGGKFSYEIIQDFSGSRTVLAGTYQSRDGNSCGETRYWVCSVAEFPSNTYEIIYTGYRNTYYVLFTNDSPYNPSFQSYYSPIYRIEKAVYDKLDTPERLIVGGRRFQEADGVSHKDGDCKPPYSGYNPANSVSITHKWKEYKGSWLVKVYEAGNYRGEVTCHARDPNDSLVMASDAIREFSSSGIERNTRTFSKQKDTQAVEVVVHPSASYIKLVYLINLDSSGNEASRGLIFRFSVPEDLGVPYHKLTCISSEKECPEGTCEVTCGDTICCYNSQGIAVDSFPSR